MIKIPREVKLLSIFMAVAVVVGVTDSVMSGPSVGASWNSTCTSGAQITCSNLQTQFNSIQAWQPANSDLANDSITPAKMDLSTMSNDQQYTLGYTTASQGAFSKLCVVSANGWSADASCTALGAGDVYITDDTQIDSALYVGGDATVPNASAEGSIVADGYVQAGTDVIATTNLRVGAAGATDPEKFKVLGASGNTTIDGTLSVAGTSTLTGAVTFSAAATSTGIALGTNTPYVKMRVYKKTFTAEPTSSWTFSTGLTDILDVRCNIQNVSGAGDTVYTQEAWEAESTTLKFYVAFKSKGASIGNIIVTNTGTDVNDIGDMLVCLVWYE